MLFCFVAACYAEEFYSFDSLVGAPLPAQIDLSDVVLHKPAGKYGRVLADGDKLRFENGGEARFWGVGLTFSGSLPPRFPPEKHLADLLVKRIASSGYNHVRFAGLDNNAPEPFRVWRKTGKISGKTIDRLDYFISKLRESGIYYSFSIINNAPLLLDELGDVPSNHSSRTRLRRYYNVKLFSNDAVRLIADWVQAFYSRKNKYTGLSIAEDPANIYVTAVNEDSIFDAYYSGYRFLDEGYVDALTKQFNQYLKNKYISVDKLWKAWDSDPDNTPSRHAFKSIKLISYKDRKHYSRQRNLDTLAFLVSIDSQFYASIKSVLKKIGYSGLFSGTNNWYGFQNLLALNKQGDYIDLHGYFDHPKYLKKVITIESVGNHSYLSNRPGKKGKQNVDIFREYSFPFSRSFSAAIENKPLIFSEWNHSFWSDYAYEGPVMMLAYASLQGYSALNLHTYLNHPNPDQMERYTRSAFTVSTNAILSSLAPSLGLAYLNGYLQSSDKLHLVAYATSEDEYLDVTLPYGQNRLLAGKPPVSGFCQKTRVRLISEAASDTGRIANCATEEGLASDNGEIFWGETVKGDGYIKIDTEKFKAVAGVLDGEVVTGNGFSVRIMTKGAVTLIALDNVDIRDSRKLLLSIANETRNTGQDDRVFNGRKYILDKGGAPVLALNPVGAVSIDLATGVKPVVTSLGLNGIEKPVNSRFATKQDGGGTLTFEFGRHKTPWYLIKVAASGFLP